MKTVLKGEATTVRNEYPMAGQEINWHRGRGGIWKLFWKGRQLLWGMNTLWLVRKTIGIEGRGGVFGNRSESGGNYCEEWIPYGWSGNDWHWGGFSTNIVRAMDARHFQHRSQAHQHKLNASNGRTLFSAQISITSAQVSSTSAQMKCEQWTHVIFSTNLKHISTNEMRAMDSRYFQHKSQAHQHKWNASNGRTLFSAQIFSTSAQFKCEQWTHVISAQISSTSAQMKCEQWTHVIFSTNLKHISTNEMRAMDARHFQHKSQAHQHKWNASNGRTLFSAQIFSTSAQIKCEQWTHVISAQISSTSAQMKCEQWTHVIFSTNLKHISTNEMRAMDARYFQHKSQAHQHKWNASNGRTSFSAQISSTSAQMKREQWTHVIFSTGLKHISTRLKKLRWTSYLLPCLIS